MATSIPMYYPGGTATTATGLGSTANAVFGPYANQQGNVPLDSRPTFKILKIENGWLIFFAPYEGAVHTQYFVSEPSEIGPQITAILVEKCLEK